MKKELSFGLFFALIFLGQTCGLNLKRAIAQAPDTIWTARYNGIANNNDEAQACAIDSSGNFYVTGESYNGSNDDVFTIKYNPVTGDTIWTRRFNKGDDGAYGCAVDGFGNLYVTGHSGFSDITIKYNAINGDTIWTRSCNGQVSCEGYAYACAVDSAGNLYVTGESNYNGTFWDYLTIKYNAATGDTIWTHRYNGPANGTDVAYGCVADRSDNLYVTGMSEDGPNYDYLTIKYNTATGDTIWTRRYNGPDNGGDVAYACAVDNSGNLYVTGYSYGDYLTIKYDANTGDTIWTARYNPGPYSSGVGCAVDGSGNLYVAGYIYNGVNADYLTIKYNPVTGDTIWTLRYNGPANGVDVANGCAVDSAGNLYVTGVSSNSANYDYLTIKYNTATGTPLSVQFVSFTASVIAGATIRLEWQTQSALNSYLWRVKRGLNNDTLDYEVIAEHFGDGTTYEPGRYYYDDKCAIGFNSYKLDEIDLSGNVTTYGPVSATAGEQITVFGLQQNTPNPFSQRTSISYQIPKSGMVNLTVYNVAGQLVKILDDGYRIAGEYCIGWNGMDQNNQKVSNGIYFYQLQAVNKQSTKKLIILK